jgi:hypothetical protein
MRNLFVRELDCRHLGNSVSVDDPNEFRTPDRPSPAALLSSVLFRPDEVVLIFGDGRTIPLSPDAGITVGDERPHRP